MSYCIVTGGSRGIGEAIVRKLTASGNKVVFTYNTGIELAEKIASETNSMSIKCDVTKKSDIERVVLCAREYFGDNPNVLINNAGIASIKPIYDIADEEFAKIMETNVYGLFYMTRAIIDDMVFSGYGRVINIASTHGITGASCETHYSASKGAIIAFTKALAAEVAPSGVTVNCIAPGVICTDMNACLSDEEQEKLTEEIPMRRIGQPSEVAELASFLAGKSAGYITGQVIAVDGGWKSCG